jgi:polysaccharide biosynthesis/export protein
VNLRTLEIARNICLLSIACVVCASGQSSALRSDDTSGNTASVVSPTGPTLVTRSTAYHLRKGDSVDLVFDLCPEFNQTLTVSPDGLISLRAADNVPAAGLTLPELATAVNAAYSNVLNNPHVSISLKATDIEKPFFVATGQVSKPGRYDLMSPTTVLEAVSLAGGFTDIAKTTNVILYRRVNDEQYQPMVVDVKKLLSAHELTSDLYVRPGDLLYVPKSTYGKIKPFIPNTSIFLDPLAY